MIDFHSHVLPNVDDGSRSVEESLEMLKALGGQGVKTLAATPHFYANSTTVDEFLDKRAEAYKLLEGKRDADFPVVLLGAELRYYEGVSGLDGIERLVLGNSKLLLLEMPMSKWTDYTLKELFAMARSQKYVLVLAHIERYYDMQSKDVWHSLKENGVLFQVNASHFIRLSTRRKALKLLQKGFVHFLGSDCHDTKLRLPVIAPAYKLIGKKFGEETVDAMLSFGYGFIGI